VNRHRHHGAAALLALGLGLGTAQAQETDGCITAGHWAQPLDGSARALETTALYQTLTQARVVLLGERHDSAEQHRWQLQVLAALHAQRPDLVIGLEMLPRSAQPVLDRWVAGELDTPAFLAASHWDSYWRFDPALYLPILDFARMNRIPLLALNVDRALVTRTAKSGWAAIPAAERGGIDDPAPPASAYLDDLREVYAQHARRGEPADEADFRHFVDSQLLWDRAMAQAIAARVQGDAPPLLVALLGRGHVQFGYGVAHQLGALGVEQLSSLLPFETAPCTTLHAGLADALFGLSPRSPRSEPPRLGVALAPDTDGVLVEDVLKDSIAAAASLRPGDIIREVGGRAVKEPGDVIAAVRRQAPGSWLPIAVDRHGRTRLLLAKFPPEPGP